MANRYERHYVDTEGRAKIRSIHGAAPVVLRTATTEENVLDLMEDGYVSVGYSSFDGPYAPLSLAVDTAENHGAALALLDIRFKETQQSASVLFLPSFLTAYSLRSFNATALGPSAAVQSLGTCSGMTAATVVNAVSTQRNKDIYSHDAMFFKKIDTSRSYGVSLFAPKRLPSEKADAPVRVCVMAVFRGSWAESEGVRRGQVVTAVNGVPIRTRKSAEPFLDNPESIKRVEVEGAE